MVVNKCLLCAWNQVSPFVTENPEQGSFSQNSEERLVLLNMSRVPSQASLLPGLVDGDIIFALSYLLTCGPMSLKEQHKQTNKEGRKEERKSISNCHCSYFFFIYFCNSTYLIRQVKRDKKRRKRQQ